MKKYLPYLERYVQWVALGLGVVYVLYMVYGYVITPPVNASLNGKAVDLGNVDKVTKDGPARELETAIQNGPANGVDAITVKPVLPDFMKKFTNANDPAATAPLPAFAWNAPTLPPFIPDQPNRPRTPNNPNPNGGTNLRPPQVAILTPPTAIYVGISSGRSAVTPPPPPTVQPVAAAPADPNQPAPVQPIQQIQAVAPAQPAQPIQGVANPAVANAQPTIDKNWVSIHYKVPSAALADAFKKAGVPPVRSVTSFLRVELVRQEKTRDGKWANETTVPPLTLAFQNAPVWPNGAAPAPADEQAYITWAQANAQAILQPVFYTVVKGDLPGVPGDPLQHAGILAPPPKVFDPAKPGLPPPGGFTPEQKQAIIEYNKQKATARPTPAPRGGARPPARANPRGGGGAGGEAAFAPRDAGRPVVLAQVRTPSPGIRRPTAEDLPPEDMGDSGMGGPGVIQQTNNDALNKLALTIPQPNSFDPAQLTVDVDVIAYDETAEPGKTYRYQMRYYILNPILGAINLVKPENMAMAQKFALGSQPTDWSLPVDVPPAVTFFLAGGSTGGDSVKLDIYRWQNGDVNRTTQQVVAGDHVGVTTKEGIDYNTKWSIVDVRSGNGDRYVLLQDDDGNPMRREFRLDANSPLKKDLDTQAAAAEAAAKAASATANPATGVRPTGAVPNPGVTANINR